MGLLKNLILVPKRAPELIQAQAQAFSKHIPLLYLMLLSNMVAVAATYRDVAPLWLTVIFPALFSVAAIARVVMWRRTRHTQQTPQQAHKKLQSTVYLVIAFGVMLTTWVFGLMSFASSDTLVMHASIFIAVTLLASVVCLTHLKQAANLLAVIIGVPLGLKLMFLGHFAFGASALICTVACITVVYVLNSHYAEFATMVSQRIDLEKQNIEALRLNDENFKLASTDALTGLSNRRTFMSDIEALIAREDQPGFAVGLIDLDGFKGVNDIYGHAAGDTVLIEAAERLRLLASDQVLFARLGGDEFAFICPRDFDLKEFGQKICTILAAPYSFESVSVELSASCGLSIHFGDAQTSSELLECADFVLYEAKRSGNGIALVFAGNHRARLFENHRIEKILKSADLAAEMTLAYQPIVSAKTGEIISVEALARWQNPLLGSVSPGQFVPIAERTTFINKLTLVLLKKLLADMATFKTQVRFSFNLSAKTLSCQQTILQVFTILQKSNTDLKRLEFEITETALLGDFDAAARSVGLLRSLGCTIALDDFGTGFSSLNYLHELQLDTIKVDGRFVRNAMHDQKAASIVKSIVSLGKGLGMKTVAEGVETRPQADMMIDNGCDQLQGYLFYRPLTAQQLMEQPLHEMTKKMAS
jgi:diguanylate cyclase (GGDEF)-like protein